MHTCNATTLDQLLSLRDGAPTEAYIVQHVNTCSACSRELERLRLVRTALRDLPTLQAPAYAVVLHAQSQLTRSRVDSRRFRKFSIAAVAASISTVALFIAFTNVPESERNTSPAATLAVTAAPIESLAEPAIADLVTRSQDLESKLRRLPSRPIVERAGTSTTIDSLQSSIQWVDYKLSQANDAGLSEQQAAQLWQDRIQLMDSLVKVRYAEAQRFAVL